MTLVDGDTVGIGAGLGKVAIRGYAAAGGNETFDVSTAVFADFDALLAQARADGADTVVKAGAGELEFVGVTLAELQQDSADFDFSAPSSSSSSAVVLRQATAAFAVRGALSAQAATPADLAGQLSLTTTPASRHLAHVGG